MTKGRRGMIPPPQWWKHLATTEVLRSTHPGYYPVHICMSPPRNTSDILRASGNPGMNDTGFSPFGQDNDPIQQPDMFGITDSTRRILTAKGLGDLLAENISKDDMRQVVIDRLNKSGGLVDAIRTAGFESLDLKNPFFFLSSWLALVTTGIL